MNYGLWMSAAGLSTEIHRQDVIANNLANAETTGFKVDQAFTRERPVASQGFGTAAPSIQMLERLGGGVLVEDTFTDFKQGALIDGNDLDLGLEGKGFFVVRDETAPDGLAFTRDGRFTRNLDGHLVDGEGRRVMSDRGDRPIRLGTGQVEISPDGRINVDGESVAKLRIADPAEGALRKVGGNLYHAAEGTAAPAATDVSVAQRKYETSNVDPIQSMNQLVQSGRSVQAAARFIDFHDQMMELAVTRIAVG